MGNGRWIHGQYGTRLNHIWASMRTRCNCKTNKDYKHYGGRGIRVCKEWDEYITFYKWAINNGYRDDLTLDRIDVDGDYCPNNCRLISNFEQQGNRRNNRIIEYNGEKHTLAEWSRITGISYQKLTYRLSVGINLDDVFEKGKMAHHRKDHYIVNGKIMYKSQICEKFSINPNTFNTRKTRGWSIEEIIKGKRNALQSI